MFDRATERLQHKTWASFNTVERLLLVAGCTACALLVAAISRTAGVPPTPHFTGSLLAAPDAVTAVLITAIAVAASTALGTVIAGFLRLEVGLICAAIGLSALAVRGGPMHPVLQYASGPAVYLVLVVETILLFAMLAGAYLLLRRLFPLIWSARLPAEAIAKPADHDVSTEPNDIAFAIAIYAVAMIVCQVLLLQSDAKKQALASVGISSLIATLAACQIAPLVEGVWYWLVAPCAVAIIGFVLAYFSPEGWQIGEVHGMLGALARATPLDYASLGVAGAILGYWTARKWKEEGEFGSTGT
jgi:hypothetical protein